MDGNPKKGRLMSYLYYIVSWSLILRRFHGLSAYLSAVYISLIDHYPAFSLGPPYFTFCYRSLLRPFPV